MIRKFIVGLALVLAATLGFAAPANAASTGTACAELGRGIVTCATVTWATSNMAITSVRLSTPQNCGNLEDGDYGRYGWWTADSPTENYSFGKVTACAKTVGIYDVRGGNWDNVAFWVDTKARVNNGEDWVIHWEFNLRKNGSSAWAIFPRPVGDCC